MKFILFIKEPHEIDFIIMLIFHSLRRKNCPLHKPLQKDTKTLWPRGK